MSEPGKMSKLPSLTVSEFNNNFIPVAMEMNTPPTPMHHFNTHNKALANFPAPGEDFYERFSERMVISFGSFWKVEKVFDRHSMTYKALKTSTRSPLVSVYLKEKTAQQLLYRTSAFLALYDEMYFDKQTFYAVMPLYTSSVLEILARRTMAKEEILFVVWSVLMGLSTINTFGLVHGDVKPKNILVDDGGRVKLSDFNSVQNIGSFCEIEELGDPRYLAPELKTGAVTASSDVYSLGISTFEMATRHTFPTNMFNFALDDPLIIRAFNDCTLKDLYVSFTKANPLLRQVPSELVGCSIFLPVVSFRLSP
ncbi:hypothetical protein EIN_430830 [Entamoeba invadens IP1]|uniref:mitogen-activated protein kinase kinase n=1 Tax=Entamoeba invadens IP1 TaxID=370355 RepID=A0A0A1UHG4_ENTIV|nr:hypothetical protein EIN_430830 [Entamoeba invadens IP1]ELP95277.1 hypothetical protein EIN_430830 [Entamoeba invadens IP1]|eukprot:XP_004262048.1 hypothetical protein EIN_430830 [Entamoeba invadens IP1]